MLANIKHLKTVSAYKMLRFVIAKAFNSRGSSCKESTCLSLNFAAAESKSRNSYLEMVKIYTDRNFVHRRGHVEFIYSALKHMEEFGVNKDLSVYKALIEVMPKGKFISKNIFQGEFMHYPKQQQCIIDVLEQMEDNGVMPDAEMEQMLLNIFGKRGFPLRKYWRMMYWMPKFKYSSPWHLPNPLPDDTVDLAKLAIDRISSVEIQATTQIYYYADKRVDHTVWIVSSQSPTQKKIIENHDQSKAIYIEGPQKVWLRNRSVDYFILKANPEATCVTDDAENPDDVSKIEIKIRSNISLRTKSVHEQKDGTILAVCATKISNKDSLLSWIKNLESDGNMNLSNIPIVFRLKSSICDEEVCLQNA